MPWIKVVPGKSKRCVECEIILSIQHFGKHKRSLDGRNHICRRCLVQSLKDRRVKGDPAQPSSTKWCRKCRQTKPSEDFSKDSGKGDGLSTYCRQCTKRWHSTKYLGRAYGITPEQYQHLLNSQYGLCAICGKEETAEHTGSRGERVVNGVMRLSVDHDHITGAIRGLLCYRCNHFVGYLQRYEPEGLAKALHYLARHSVERTAKLSNQIDL